MPQSDPEARREYQRNYQRRWRAANKEKVIAATRKYRKANPEKCLEGQRAYRKSHIEKYREASKRNHAKHREKDLIRNRAWYRNNPELVYWYSTKKRIAVSAGIPLSQIPNELVEAWIAIIRAKKEIKSASGVRTTQTT